MVGLSNVRVRFAVVAGCVDEPRPATPPPVRLSDVFRLLFTPFVEL